MFESELVFRQLFEANYDVVVRCIYPAAFGDECCANFGELLIVEDAKLGAFNVDLVASI